MIVFFRIAALLSVKPLIAHAVCNFQHAWAITSVHGVSNLITGLFQLYGFDKSVYSRKVLF